MTGYDYFGGVDDFAAAMTGWIDAVFAAHPELPISETSTPGSVDGWVIPKRRCG